MKEAKYCNKKRCWSSTVWNWACKKEGGEKSLSESFVNWILRKIHFFKHEGAMCQWRRLKSVFQFWQEIFIAAFMDTRIQQRTCTPHMYRPLLPMVETPWEQANTGAETHLDEEEPYQNSTATAPALAASPRVADTRNCWGAAASAREIRLLRKKPSGDIDFRKGSANAAWSQMCDHIHTCEIVPVILRVE